MSDEKEDLYFICIMTKDGLYREIQCDKDYKPREIKHALAPMIERKYIFNCEDRATITSRWIKVNDHYLDNYDYVTMRYYEEVLPTDLKPYDAGINL